MSAPSPQAPVGLPDLGLGGSVVIVTGAGSGIGAAAARHLAAAGASVVLVGRRTAPLESVADAIVADGGQVIDRELPSCEERAVRGGAVIPYGVARLDIRHE